MADATVFLNSSSPLLGDGAGRPAGTVARGQDRKFRSRAVGRVARTRPGQPYAANLRVLICSRQGSKLFRTAEVPGRAVSERRGRAEAGAAGNPGWHGG